MRPGSTEAPHDGPHPGAVEHRGGILGLLAATIVIVALSVTGRLIGLTVRALAVLMRVLATLVIAYVGLTFVLIYLVGSSVTR